MKYINQLDLPVIKAVGPKQDFKEYENVILLFDSPQGGSGQTFDWESLMTNSLKNKFFIAGGLNPENVAAAIQHFPNAYGVDVSSGLETEGQKDLKKLNPSLKMQSMQVKINIFN